jgi:hypothetical protein
VTQFHITNGDSAVESLRAAGIEGGFLAWQDALHEGPVPAGLTLAELRPVRAEFVAAQGWAAPAEALELLARRDAALAAFRGYAEVVLWFEHDLYDQLQLIQLLDWFSERSRGPARLSLVGAGEYLGGLAASRVQELYAARHDVSPGELALGRAAWAAFRAPEPTVLMALLQQDMSVLPYLAGALTRHLQEYPAAGTGLSRSETQILEALAHGPRPMWELYPAAHHAREERVYLGDTVFAGYVGRLSRETRPLLMLTGEAAPGEPWPQTASLTPEGRAVLGGRADRVTLNGLDRWLGGVYLHGHRAGWRWDRAAGRLIAA